MDTGVGREIYSLRVRIQKITSELNELDSSFSDQPELIKSANLLRSNEHLLETYSKSSELISAYKQYCEELEKMLKTVFDIQKDLKDILKTQSTLIAKQKKSKTSKSKKKPSKK